MKTIFTNLIGKVEERPYDKGGKCDHNFNYIHQVHVADAMIKIREIIANLQG